MGDTENSRPVLDLNRKDEKGENLTGEDSTFQDYDFKSDVYAKIAEEMMTRFEYGATDVGDLIENGKWVPVSDDRRQSGLLSICPVLSTLFSMDVDMLEQSTFGRDSSSDARKEFNCRRYRKETLAMFQFVIDHITSADGKGFVYDISPHIVQIDPNIKFTGKTKPEAYSFGENTSYLGTICWVGEVMAKAYTLATTMDENGKPLLGLRHLDPEEIWGADFELEPLSEEEEAREHSEQLAIVKKIVKDCIDKIVNYTIVNKNDEGEVEKAVGWTFTKPSDSRENELSLYFTYRVADFWLILFNCLGEQYYLFKDIERTYYKDLDKSEDIGSYWGKDRCMDVLKEMRDDLGRIISNRSRSKKKENPIDSLISRYEKMSEDYERINFLFSLNGGKPITDPAGNFARLKVYLLDVARTIWERYGNEMDSSFFYSDFSKVPREAIGKGGSNNILFNTLFMQDIMISAALDMELLDNDKMNGTNTYKTFLDTMQATLQNILDMYTIMKREGNQYKVDRYKISMDSDKSMNPLVTKIRKADMTGHVLVPLLTKVNNLLSEYIVKYPQKQMRNYLEMILGNSVVNDGKACWIWDADGYSAVSNFYYVDALIDFYTYYEEYERKYLINDKGIRMLEEEQRNKVTVLETENSKKDVTIKQLEEEKTQIEKEKQMIEDQDSITKMIKELVESSFEENFYSQLRNIVVKNPKIFSEAVLLSIAMDITDQGFKDQMTQRLGIQDETDKDTKIIDEVMKKMKKKIREISKE